MGQFMCMQAIAWLDEMGKGGRSSVLADARAIYDELHARQQSQHSADLQEPLDRLRARLRFFGQQV